MPNRDYLFQFGIFWARLVYRAVWPAALGWREQSGTGTGANPGNQRVRQRADHAGTSSPAGERAAYSSSIRIEIRRRVPQCACQFSVRQSCVNKVFCQSKGRDRDSRFRGGPISAVGDGDRPGPVMARVCDIAFRFSPAFVGVHLLICFRQNRFGIVVA